VGINSRMKGDLIVPIVGAGALGVAHEGETVWELLAATGGNEGDGEGVDFTWPRVEVDGSEFGEDVRFIGGESGGSRDEGAGTLCCVEEGKTEGSGESKLVAFVGCE